MYRKMGKKEDKECRVLDFSSDPGPRYKKQGVDSGEAFYAVLKKAFNDAVKSNVKLKIILDGTSGYASSFLDEAFGRLVYSESLESVKQRIKIISEEEPEWIDMLYNKTFSEWEDRRKNKQAPKST